MLIADHLVLGSANTRGGSMHPSHDNITQYWADMVNLLVLLNSVTSVIDFSCSNAGLADLLDVPLYIGVPGSSPQTRLPPPTPGRRYLRPTELKNIRADLCLSIDMMSTDLRANDSTQHLHALFNASRRLVLICNLEQTAQRGNEADLSHSLQCWIERHRTDFVLLGNSVSTEAQTSVPIAMQCAQSVLFQRFDTTL